MKAADSLVDAWRRLAPGQPRIGRSVFYAVYAKVPSSLPRHQLALIGETPEQPKWAAFECPCGTGHRIMVSLRPARGGSWTIIRDARQRLSLHPSIDSVDERRCHFWLRHGKVAWAPTRRRGRRASL